MTTGITGESTCPKTTHGGKLTQLNAKEMGVSKQNRRKSFQKSNGFLWFHHVGLIRGLENSGCSSTNLSPCSPWFVFITGQFGNKPFRLCCEPANILQRWRGYSRFFLPRQDIQRPPSIFRGWLLPGPVVRIRKE
jgi:hypothetical protein